MPFEYDTLELGLALSGTPESAKDVLRQGFQAVINVWDPHQPPYTTGLPPLVRLVQQPIEDAIPAPIAFLRRATLELAEFRRRELWTLVHCQAGQSRSAAIVALYWMGRDGITWDEALRRMRVVRPQVQPHPLLVDAPTRAAVVRSIRAYLAGDESLLLAAREDAEVLLEVDNERGPAPETTDWSEIEPGVGCGGAPLRLEELERVGYSRLLNLSPFEIRLTGSQLPRRMETAEFVLPEASAADPSIVAAAVGQLRAWQQEGEPVFVACSDGKSRSALIVALHFMIDRGWDFPAAMWYIRKRRPGAWPRPQLLEGRSIAQLQAACLAGYSG